MYKIGIFIKTKDSEKLKKWLPERYPDFDSVNSATDKKNIDLGHELDQYGNITPKPGQSFAMFDDA